MSTMNAHLGRSFPMLVKVLLGSDTDIDTPHRFEVFDHLGVRRFVGNEIIGIEISALFGELDHALRKIGELVEEQGGFGLLRVQRRVLLDPKRDFL